MLLHAPASYGHGGAQKSKSLPGRVKSTSTACSPSHRRGTLTCSTRGSCTITFSVPLLWNGDMCLSCYAVVLCVSQTPEYAKTLSSRSWIPISHMQNAGIKVHVIRLPLPLLTVSSVAFALTNTSTTCVHHDMLLAKYILYDCCCLY